MKKILFLSCLFISTIAFSQTKKFTISGIIKSEDDKELLESATVHLERLKDSSIVSYTISNEKGAFNLEGETSDSKIKLVVSFIGFKPYSKIIDVKNQNVGSLLLTGSNVLDGVVIKSSAPITIKKDTLEFNVKSFKTKADANVEDLLKKLPGVEVDDEGAITVNGKSVNKILVNGKPFFGNDPTITTRNLTKDIIEKIQISDTKTNAQAFSGEDSDGENKTINLTIKKENNKGYFGKVAAGAGTDDRNEYAGMITRFKQSERIGLLAGGNNINSPGFSFGNQRLQFGGNNRSFGGGQGIVTSNNYGANYINSFGKIFEFSGDYFYKNSSSDNKSTSDRETFLSDGTSFYRNSENTSLNDSDSHDASIDFEVEIDSTFRIDIESDFNKNLNTNRYNSISETLDNSKILTNDSQIGSIADSDKETFNNEINLTKRFGSKGAFLRVELTANLSKTLTDDFVKSETNIYGSDSEQIIRDQYSDGSSNVKELASEITYRFPIIANNLFLDAAYTIGNTKTTNKRSTFDFDDNTNDYSDFSELLSTDFKYSDKISRPSLELEFRNEKWSASTEIALNNRTLENTDYLRPETNLEREFNNLEYGLNVRFRKSRANSYRLRYNFRNSTPSLSQLQPFRDESNPLNIVTGNPALSPSKTHSLRFGAANFNWQNRTGFWSYANISFTNDRVVAKTTINTSTLIRETTYANVDGFISARAGGSYSSTKKWEDFGSLKTEFRVFADYSKNINFNNDVQYSSKIVSISPNIGFDFSWDDILQIRPSYTISFSKNTYDIDSFSNKDFTNHDVTIATSTNFLKKFEWLNDVNYNYNPNIADGFQKSAWFWNTTLRYSILKDNGAISLKIYDILDQNTNARRVATEDYIQDSSSTVLNQYAMLSFTWKFNSLGNSGKKFEPQRRSRYRG
ncbi:CarboxypepD_reg-like domain-containing protein [Polaribacter sp. KT25b]|uniref:outer membrane beta-barrel protein n=1 Tax=Polaribacter sp. KT25b TaxID=1855336 RepID=UPI00087CC7DD|nr:outer membrane beta-barrel protein [Polaribacter sp. KT25b]SDS39311.1 CarboxypepD_reg-like domain-containing protein [Polaribacter sp. KT25b]